MEKELLKKNRKEVIALNVAITIFATIFARNVLEKGGHTQIFDNFRTYVQAKIRL